VKFYYEALKLLPDHFVHDDTVTTMFNDKTFAVNPEFAPMIYDPATKEWTELKPTHPLCEIQNLDKDGNEAE